MASARTWTFDLREDTRVVLRHGLATAGGDTVGAPAEPLADERWSQLRSEVVHHRLDGLLVASVAAGELTVTDAQRAETARLEVQLTKARMWQERRFVDVIDRLGRAGVDARVLKGPALAWLDYPDPQWRPTSDLDLLVRGDQIAMAREVLGADGGRQLEVDPVAGYGATIGKGGGVELADGLEVDLHRVLVAGAFGVRVCAEDLWEAGRPFAFGGAELTTLSVEATLLHACYHLLIFGYPRALTLRDVAQLLGAPGLDPDRVLWLARRWQGTVVLATALLMVRDELDPIGPTTLLEWADGYVPTVRERAWLRIERSGDHISPLMAIGEYLALRSPAERALFRRATFDPAPGTWPRLSTRAWRLTRRVAGRDPVSS